MKYALCLSFVLPALCLLPVPLLPILSWPAGGYSDWFNIKNAPCLAKGDGLTDDTKAIQCGMDAFHVNNNFTVFFPPGVYLVSNTVIINRTLGAAIIGMGRTSVLKWSGGPTGGVGPNNNVSVMVSKGKKAEYRRELLKFFRLTSLHTTLPCAIFRYGRTETHDFTWRASLLMQAMVAR